MTKKQLEEFCMTPEQTKAASRKEKEAILIEMASDLMLTKTQQKLAQRKLDALKNDRGKG